MASVILDVTGLSTEARGKLEAGIKAALGAVPGVASGPRRHDDGEARAHDHRGRLGQGRCRQIHRLGQSRRRHGARGAHRVGLVDADIYGPSQPRLMAAEGRRPTALRTASWSPMQTPWGVPMLSMGQLVPPGQAIAWRGPMAGNALGQLIDADWGETRILILDLPPGTGDVQLTMVQKHKPAGALIVSTPQDLALMDATRAISFFEQRGGAPARHGGEYGGLSLPALRRAIPIPSGRAARRRRRKTMGLDFLGRIPLEIAIRRASDAGEPPAAGNGPEAAPFRALAERIAARLNLKPAGGLKL